MATIKENYEAINEILRQNQANVAEVYKVIKEIEDMYKVCIPILVAMTKPSIDKIHDRMVTKKTIQLDYGNLDKQTLQAMLDRISPIKLVVEEMKEYPWNGTKEITVSLA